MTGKGVVGILSSTGEGVTGMFVGALVAGTVQPHGPFKKSCTVEQFPGVIYPSPDEYKI